MIKDRTAACFWSSGKDSCLALYKAKEQGYEIKYLVNFISQQYGRVSFHGARAELVHLQAEALGIPLLQRETTGDDYEEVFRKSLKEVKEKQVNQVVRGDIHLQELKDWVEDVCQSEGFGVVSPIWHKPAKELLNEFIGLGFKAIVT
ncbi:MAG: ATP pyrophosphatase, partial [Candidatus Omnitrophica bacterium]|nr:ATP pyrophosphatase [Candidatus Omnitrophota bacterium]